MVGVGCLSLALASCSSYRLQSVLLNIRLLAGACEILGVLDLSQFLADSVHLGLWGKVFSYFLPSSIPMAAKFCLESVTVLSQKTVSGFPSVIADFCFVLVQNPERVDICWSCVGEIHSSSRGRCVLLLPLPRKPWRWKDLLFSRWWLKAFT